MENKIIRPILLIIDATRKNDPNYEETKDWDNIVEKYYKNKTIKS